MFALRSGLRFTNVATRSSRLAAVAQCTSRRGMAFSINDWAQKHLQAKLKTKDTADSIKDAKERQAERGEESVFDAVKKLEVAAPENSKSKKTQGKPLPTTHNFSTAVFKISPRKLNMLGRQIAGKPIDQAILQMVFSEKRASTRIKSTLCIARDHAQDKGLDRDKLIVSQAWVEKNRIIKFIDIKGRGRHGVKRHRYARLKVELKEGKTKEEKMAELRAMRIKRIVSSGLVREDRPIRNPSPMWAW